MPRDANGNYTLPSGNPVAADTVIETGWANPTMADIGTELQNSLDRSGRGGMLVPFKNVDGTKLLPGITFTLEPASGIYRFGTSDLRVSVNGGDVVRYIDDSGTTPGDQQPFLIWDGLVWNAPLTNANISLSSPPPLGDVTPNTGAFTVLAANTGNITAVVASTVNVTVLTVAGLANGRDIAVDGAKLDTIQSGATNSNNIELASTVFAALYAYDNLG